MDLSQFAPERFESLFQLHIDLKAKPPFMRTPYETRLFAALNEFFDAFVATKPFLEANSDLPPEIMERMKRGAMAAIQIMAEEDRG